MRAADYIIDVGPGAGIHGGEIVAAGTPEESGKCTKSLTGMYLARKKMVAVPNTRRKGNGNLLTIRGATENNLKNVDVSIPLGTFTCVTGVSGSVSSLVNEILFKRLGADLNRMKACCRKHQSIEGEEYLDKVIDIDQSPSGGHHAAILPPIRGYSTISVTCLRQRRMQRLVATDRGVFLSTCAADAARLVRVTGF